MVSFDSKTRGTMVPSSSWIMSGFDYNIAVSQVSHLVAAFCIKFTLIQLT